MFFRILLSDAATRRAVLWSNTHRIENEIIRRVAPLEQWGVLPYFSYRSESEQALLNEPAWAA